MMMNAWATQFDLIAIETRGLDPLQHYWVPGIRCQGSALPQDFYICFVDMGGSPSDA